MTKQIERVAFRPGPLLGPLMERAEAPNDRFISQIAQRDLDRYYTALALALNTVSLSENEAMFLIDISNGTLYDMVAAQALQWEIEDAIPDYAAKWEVDGPALLAKANGWNLLQKTAIMDALERFWNDAYHIENTQAKAARVGLIKPVH